MLALFANPLIRDAMLGFLLLTMLGGAYGYYRWSQAEMAVLQANVATVSQQANDLLAAKTKLDRDLVVIKGAQDTANTAIAQARAQAAQTARSIRAAQPALPPGVPSDPHILQNQINADQAASLHALEALSQ